jgi:hypothetical protein
MLRSRDHSKEATRSKRRITAQLIDAPADKHLWAKSYERDSRDVLALQDELASAIARIRRPSPRDGGDRGTEQAVVAWLRSAVEPGDYLSGLGDRRRALDGLEKAYAAHAQWMAWLKMARIFDPLRSEPRFIALMKKVHFEK